MADPVERRPQNVDGPWFVDETCIDCGTCMWMAPHIFADADGKSAVHLQPPARDMDASAALLSCPTGSIGGPAGPVRFPRPVGDKVWHCGYHARASFGAASYLVRTNEGNVLVDSPRFVKPLANTIEEMGGLSHILLTHRDDVADHQKWHDRFGAPRAIHASDDTIGADVVLDGDGGTVAGLEWTHVPGHTEGSVVYRHQGVLLTGDHLAGRGQRLRAFRSACWYDWPTQIKSMERLVDLPVTHVLPGHGAPWRGDVAAYRRGMEALIAWMADVA